MASDWTDGTDDAHSPWDKLPGVRTGEELSKGERAADIVRNKMGSWGFVGAFMGFMGIWAVANVVLFANRGFDPYPFILLNLLLSTLAGLQGAILLIAARRADAVAAEQALSHLTISKTSGEILQELRSEVRELRRMIKTIQDRKDAK